MAQLDKRYSFNQQSPSIDANFDKTNSSRLNLTNINLGMTTISGSPLFLSRRTPRRKLFSSSEDDESPLILSLKASKSISLIDPNHQADLALPMADVHDLMELRPSLSAVELNHMNLTRQSKLEQFGFDKLPRSTALLNRSKSRTKSSSLVLVPHRNKSKKNRPVEVQTRNSLSYQPMKTRLQSSSDSHPDHLVKLFDKTLSTVTPVRDSTNDDISLTGRYRHGQPLPLILSDSCQEDDMPVLTMNDNDLTLNETKKRSFEQLQTDENLGGRTLKRSKISHDEENKENSFYLPPPSLSRLRRGFVRCLSEQQPVTNEEQIKASVELGSNRNLVGDRSRTYLLPRCTSRKHADLACISAETMIDLLRGKYSSEIEQLHIIDCRYPYEYDGGHISIAKNFFTRPQIYEEYFRSPIQPKDPSKRIVFVFHCEFSSERAPSLLRYMRSEDRNIHAANYPALHYPELYLLEGGYKALFEYSTEFCKPNFYRTMLDEQFQDQCRRFRAFSKQAEKCSSFNDGHLNFTDDNPSTKNRRIRSTAIRSSLSLCFSSSTATLTSEIDFS